jgi:hypothetical protein
VIKRYNITRRINADTGTNLPYHSVGQLGKRQLAVTGFLKMNYTEILELFTVHSFEYTFIPID